MEGICHVIKTEEDLWMKLALAYQPPADKPKSAGIALVLGAGVSLASNLPNWKNLLLQVAQKCFRFSSLQQAEEWLQQMKDEGFTLPAIATLLEERSRKSSLAECSEADLKFAFLVRQALYQNFVWKDGEISKHNNKKFSKKIRESNPTLAAIASLCVIKVGSRKYKANPLIQAIVTFNLDPILQGYVRATYQNGLLRTVERPSAGTIQNKTNIYHMHGMIRWDNKWDNFKKAAPDSLVLTEQQYFDFFDRPTSMFNYTFLHILREHPCLFIGLSMSDDNLRRLLHYSYRERVEAYMKEGLARAASELRARRHFAIRKRPRDRKIAEMLMKSFSQLGVEVLWVDGFEEIPNKLRELYEYHNRPDKKQFDERNWNDVYGPADPSV